MPHLPSSWFTHQAWVIPTQWTLTWNKMRRFIPKSLLVWVSRSPQTGEGRPLPSAFSQMNALVPGLLDERQHHFHLPFLAYESSQSCPGVLHSHCFMKFKSHRKKALASVKRSICFMWILYHCLPLNCRFCQVLLRTVTRRLTFSLQF